MNTSYFHAMVRVMIPFGHEALFISILPHVLNVFNPLENQTGSVVFKQIFHRNAYIQKNNASHKVYGRTTRVLYRNIWTHYIEG